MPTANIALAVSLKRHSPMAKHYQEIVDKVFGSYYKHRTLRTLFDPNSNEWTETTISEKLQIVKKLLEDDEADLEEILIGYKLFYQNELANKSHVLNSLQDALAILLTNSLK